MHWERGLNVAKGRDLERTKMPKGGKKLGLLRKQGQGNWETAEKKIRGPNWIRTSIKEGGGGGP